jgi:hypothetical protein
MISGPEILLAHTGGTSMSSVAPSAVFTFETPRQALAAQMVLRRALIDQEEVPPPSEVETSCGVALRIPLTELYEAIGALATDNAQWEAVYQLGEDQKIVTKLG